MNIILSSLAPSTPGLLSGCIAIGNRDALSGGGGTIGQQLIDLKTAEANGAITREEYQLLKAKALGKR